MNLNPSLIMGLAAEYAAGRTESEGAPITPYDRQYLELRIYSESGSGFWFVQARHAGRWYWKDSADADHFTRAEIADIDSAIAGSIRVQIIGSHGRNLGVWSSWKDFRSAIESDLS